MLRDLKFFRRNSGKNSTPEEIENVPVNPKESSVIQTGTDSTRPPLNTIQEPSQNSRHVVDQEAILRSKIDRTPSKVKGKSSDATLPVRTPDKQGLGFSAKSRFGWAQKNESGSNGAEIRDDGLNHLPPSSRGSNIGNGGFMNMTPRSTRTTGRVTSSNHSESNSTQSTPTKSVTKPSNPGLALSGGSRPPVSVGTRAGQLAAMSKGMPISSVPLTIVNTVDVPHFELREDPSFWMDHNVQVLIRVRPLNGMERSLHGYSRCLKQETAQSITWIGQPETRFTFDHVACETVEQEMLFRVAGLPMVENCLSGYNSCMFAYGQTGSGKTHTMLGEIDELDVKPSPHRGMTPRIFEFLFARIRAEEESRMDERLKYNCKCSFIEIYNEQITDLLDPSSTNLLLREDIKKGVYVENLTELEVQTVNDILKLLTQGAANRKVAATNMNRESSRSHSVFTCVIESRWEKDSTSNLRFARLNLVDLAGSERQKTSGAEGERLKEAASINKSLSTLGHVIMVLVDVAHGKQRHVPYRDSRLTFLLQDSLGGNSKTMIIANVSPSICCAAETLSTLKFAQRAKLIQNNAVVNEDASGDVVALQHQIRLLKEELSVFKRQNVSRSLSFQPSVFEETNVGGQDTAFEETIPEIDCCRSGDSHGSVSLDVVRVSTKQLKSLEATLAGALRRERMADGSIKQLEAEIEQLNRLVRQREEDTRCTKMLLRFREDKIQRLESLMGGFMTSDTYLLEENNALSEEIQLLQAKVDRNPEVTRFALENIRLLEQLRSFQDFYEEGEREILLAEVSELRDQLFQFINGSVGQHNHPNVNIPQDAVLTVRENESFHLELKNTQKELEACRNNLKSCLESNEQLSRELNDLHSQLNNFKSAIFNPDDNVVLSKESSMEDPMSETHLLEAVKREKAEWKHAIIMKHSEELVDLQLELDILKIILKEERSSRGEREEIVLCLNRDLELAKEKCLLLSKQYEDTQDNLKDTRTVIEALESQQILAINELEDLRDSNRKYTELLSKQEQEISGLKQKLCSQKLRCHPSSMHSESGDSPLQTKVKGMQDSLEKAKRLNMWYQSDKAFQTSHEQEMDEVRRQVEAETAEVIVCLQDDLATLQKQVEDNNAKETETKNSLLLLENESKELQERFYLITQDNKRLGETLEEKDEQLRVLSEEWERLTCEIQEILSDGHAALKDASNQLDLISNSFPQRRTWVTEQVGRVIRTISEKELLIQELERCLEDAHNKRTDMEWMLRSLKGATLAITEAQQQDNCEKEKEILLLKSRLEAQTSSIAQLENRIMLGKNEARKATTCATVAFVIVNRLSEINSDYCDALKHKDFQLSESVEINLKKDALLHDQVAAVEEAEKQIQALKMELEASEESCDKLRLKLSEELELVGAMEQKLEEFDKEDLLKTRQKLDEFKTEISTLNSCMNEYAEQVGGPVIVHAGQKVMETRQIINEKEAHFVGDMVPDTESFKVGKNVNLCFNNLESGRTCKDLCNGDATIILLRKEIEYALESLKGVRAKMAKLLEEKEENRKSEEQNRAIMESLAAQILTLQAEIGNFEKLCDLQMTELDNKLRIAEDIAQDACICWGQTKEMLELELSDAKAVAMQKTAETSCLFTKFEEAQETMEEADIMVNALMTANETTKIEIERLEKSEASLTNERDILIIEVTCLQSSNDLKDRQYDNLEKQFSSNLVETRSLVLALEDIIGEVKTTFKEDFMSTVCDFHCLKTQLLQSTDLMKSWLEDIWSEIIVKDCAVSVLHLCHMGILLETVTGLNAENGLLQYGLCESNSIIADLREHNVKSKRELEMCRLLKGKLLSDFKNSFNRMTRKEDETRKLGVRLTSFEKKILDLQFQEESMLARSNSMTMELATLMKDLDISKTHALTALLDQEKLLKTKDDVITSQDEFIMIDLSAKDFELLIMASELRQLALQKVDMERERDAFSEVLENLKKEMIFLIVDADLEKQLSWDKEIEFGFLQQEVEEAQTDRKDLSLKLEICSLRVTQMEKANMTLEQDIQSLRETICLHDTLKGELGQVTEANLRLSKQVQVLETENETLFKDLGVKKTALECSSSHISVLDLQNQKLLDDICLLEASLSRVQSDLDLKESDLNKLSSIKGENDLLKNEMQKLKAEQCRVLEDLQEKESELQSSFSQINVFNLENHSLQDQLSKQVQVLETENETLFKDLGVKETALECSSSHISVLYLQNQKLQNDICLLEASLSRVQSDLDLKESELNKLSSVEGENDSLKNEMQKLKAEHCRVLEDLQEKGSELQSSFSQINVFNLENHSLQDQIFSLETCIAGLRRDLDLSNVELEELRQSQAVTAEELSSRTQDLEINIDRICALKEKNDFLTTKLMSLEQARGEVLSLSNLHIEKCFDSVKAVNTMGERVFKVLNEESIAFSDKMFQEICDNRERASNLIADCDCLEHFVNVLITENLSLKDELLRKDEVLKGLSFDLSLLQESASKAMDQKDEYEEMVAVIESLEDDLAARSGELDEAVVHGQMLENQLQEKINIICTLELDISKERESLKLILNENLQLRAHLEDAMVTKSSIEEELTERRVINDRMEEELLEMGNAVGQMKNMIEELKNHLNEVTGERDHLHSELLILKEKLEQSQAMATENEAISMEARQTAESAKIYADEKEEEVKLLERSVEELECTVNVLENKVDLIKGEAERQRLQREELEMELHTVRHQMMAVPTSGVIVDPEIQTIKDGQADMRRLLNDKENELQEAQRHIQIIEKDIAEKDAEIAQCKVHISELNLHAEAQAREYTQRFKALEAMAEQVKPEAPSTYIANSSSNKSEKNNAKPRGSGSPFKCIGLGLSQQIKSEKDEELTAGRLRIEELEALAVSRQKEIFMLNARLAAAESMTHDVIRDLLGVKLDMTHYASILDHQHVRKITEKDQKHSTECLVQEQEMVKMKQQLNEFIKERQCWLEEIDRKQAEMVAIQIALEKLRQRDQLLTTENEMLKMESVNYKKKVMGLEDEVKKLSGQQNLQQRIHHHAKIKEENNLLKVQIEDLSAKLRRTEAMLSRVKEELSHYRASGGRTPLIDFDEEQRLNDKLKASEEEIDELAQKLLCLCTNILKVAGIKRPVSDISLPVAEEALNQLEDQVTSLEAELHDLKFKNKISGERIRLSELNPCSPPLSLRTDENCPTPRRVSNNTPFLSALSR